MLAQYGADPSHCSPTLLCVHATGHWRDTFATGIFWASCRAYVASDTCIVPWLDVGVCAVTVAVIVDVSLCVHDWWCVCMCVNNMCVCMYVCMYALRRTVSAFLLGRHAESTCTYPPHSLIYEMQLFFWEA